MLSVTLVPILEDNYAYILQSGDDVAVVDPGDAAPIIEKLEELNLAPSLIFNTHHHSDHIAGNQALVQKYGAKLIAPAKEASRITNIDQGVSEGDMVNFGNEIATIIEAPAHTRGHICLWFEKSGHLFVGDTLFVMGCGRPFEGTAEDLFEAFNRFRSLPDDTKIYCGHEYTLSNSEFCLNIEPNNKEIITRAEEVRRLRSKNLPTIPTTLDLEKKTNVFLRAKTADALKNLRELKDKF